MKKQFIKDFLSIAFIVALILGSGWAWNWWQNRGEEERFEAGYSEANAVNVIGTLASPTLFIGSTTAAVTISTTTGTIYVGNDVNVLNFEVQAVAVSSTPQMVAFQVEQSNTANCATTTADGIADIYWTDATPITTTAKTATTTYYWTPDDSRTGVTHQITNWNALCARFRIGSASSTIWVSASKQSLNAN